ncbi:hypothetical protein RFI_20892 [Reticulomyxa filosa]|uniref:EF-hand domain-containing protein n=1 Tax=Reticulomyxa filosa TaxID=46433 RepID=X6MRM6_RETFI|nr:hypothetical protein RFI_20892 [Reticulomyxa filosa]|eukprot:ETO16449.1 hypothetical protein RFI_20892 [Reticulomyxa filosa]
MQAVAMKFPKIRRSFVATQTVFLHCSKDNNHIQSTDVRQCLTALGLSPQLLTDEFLNRIMSRTISNKNCVTFKEFLITVALGCFLNEEVFKGEQPKQLGKIQEGFRVVKEAFTKMDTDKSGKIDYEELKQAFLAVHKDDLIQERMNELGLNEHKAIEFPEFVYGMTTWVFSIGDDVANSRQESPERYLFVISLEKLEQYLNLFTLQHLLKFIAKLHESIFLSDKQKLVYQDNNTFWHLVYFVSLIVEENFEIICKFYLFFLL